MRKAVVLFAVTAMFAAPAMADIAIPGNFTGWDANVTMTEGPAGVWSYDVSGMASNEWLQWVLLWTPNDWGTKVHPAGDQWGYADPSGNNTITLDTNPAGDGWFPDSNRVGVAYEFIDSWTAVGDWQSQIAGGDWDPSNANTLMTSLGGGIYVFEATLTPGDYNYKAVQSTTWNSIGGNSRNVNADNFPFTVTAENPTAQMYVDVLTGVVKVDVVPEPASLLLLVLGGTLLRRR